MTTPEISTPSQSAAKPVKASENLRAFSHIIRSSDAVLFYIYRTHLQSTTGGFPSPEIPTLDEIVELSETANVLEILFQFVHPARQPSVVSLELDWFFALAEAAEKYEVYGAMNTCRTRMYQILNPRPMEVLNYAIKHDYPDIIDQVAPISISRPSALTEAADALTHPGALRVWLKYYAQWASLTKEALRSLAKVPSHQTKEHSQGWSKLTSQHILKVIDDPSDFRVYSNEYTTCHNCIHYAPNQSTINQDLSNRYAKIVKFRDLM